MFNCSCEDMFRGLKSALVWFHCNHSERVLNLKCGALYSFKALAKSMKRCNEAVEIVEVLKLENL